MNCAMCQNQLTEPEEKHPRNQVNKNGEQIPICTSCEIKAFKTSAAKLGFRLGA